MNQEQLELELRYRNSKKLSEREEVFGQVVELFNPYHDVRGRFASAGRNVTGSTSFKAGRVLGRAGAGVVKGTAKGVLGAGKLGAKGVLGGARLGWKVYKFSVKARWKTLKAVGNLMSWPLRSAVKHAAGGAVGIAEGAAGKPLLSEAELQEDIRGIDGLVGILSEFLDSGDTTIALPVSGNPDLSVIGFKKEEDHWTASQQVAADIIEAVKKLKSQEKGMSEEEMDKQLLELELAYRNAKTLTERGAILNEIMLFNPFHKGKGPGGGQFASKTQGSAASSGPSTSSKKKMTAGKVAGRAGGIAGGAAGGYVAGAVASMVVAGVATAVVAGSGFNPSAMQAAMTATGLLSTGLSIGGAVAGASYGYQKVKEHQEKKTSDAEVDVLVLAEANAEVARFVSALESALKAGKQQIGFKAKGNEWMTKLSGFSNKEGHIVASADTARNVASKLRGYLSGKGGGKEEKK